MDRRKKTLGPGATADSDADIDDGRDAHPRNPSDPVSNGIFAIDGYERFDPEHTAEIPFELSHGPDFLQGPFGS